MVGRGGGLRVALPVVAITRGVPGETALPGAEVRVARDEPPLSRPELLEFVRGATAVVCMFHDRVDAEFLAAAGPGLRGVCTYAVGYDNIDLPACRRAGVTVCHTPGATTEGTANLAWGLLLAVARRIVPGDAFVRSGRWEREGNGFPKGWNTMDLADRTLLIVGAGRIGLAVARRGVAFGMRVEYVARSEHPEFHAAPVCAERAGLDEGLARADVVSLHTPLTPDTRHLLDARRLALLKPTAIVVNTSRGPVIDEAALAAALRAERLYGAGLDVFEHEPAVHPDLLGLDRVALSPHVGSAEARWRIEMTRMVMASAAALVEGRRPPSVVPESQADRP